MKCLPVIILSMTAGLIICLSGCGSRNTAWVEPSELVVPGSRHIDTSLHKNIAVSGLSAFKYSARAGNMQNSGTAVFQKGNSSGVFAAVTDRILANVNEWNDYRSELASGIIDRRQVAELEKPLTPSLPVEDMSVEEVVIPEYSDSTDYLNWRMRVALLESRLKAASSESDKSILRAKLEKAQESLKDSESIFQKPVSKIPLATKPDISNLPVQKEQVANREANIISTKNSDISEKHITGTITQIKAAAYVPMAKGSGNQQIQDVDKKYNKIQSDTINKIGDVIEKLRARKISHTPDNL